MKRSGGIAFGISFGLALSFTLGLGIAACSSYGDDPVTPSAPVPAAPAEAGVAPNEVDASDVTLEIVDSGRPDSGSVGADAGEEPAPPPRDLIAFLTKTTVRGDFGGSFAEVTADQICQDAALSYYPRKFKAYLSSIIFDVRTRVLAKIAGHRIVLPTNSLIAADGATIGTGSLLQAIAIDEYGAFYGPSTKVWTGVDPGGFQSSASCGNWKTAASQQGAAGAVVASAAWASASKDDCESSAHLYCFEIP